jgi:hypothetical protein
MDVETNVGGNSDGTVGSYTTYESVGGGSLAIVQASVRPRSAR